MDAIQIMRDAGMHLRELREQLGLTLRDVENATLEIATKNKNESFIVNLSRLSDIESKGVLPTIYRAYSLSVVYRVSMIDLLGLYGIHLDETQADAALAPAPNTHLVPKPAHARVNVPLEMDPSFNLNKTTNLGRLVERWGVVPLAFLREFEPEGYSYGYVGTEDFTMYPLLMPGTFLQIDQKKTRISAGEWRSEYERPIYFFELREGFVASWSSLQEGKIVLQPHPLSPEPVRMLDPHEVEVIGQVVAVAMRLQDWTRLPSSPALAGR
jgi:hypothetical protein